MSQRQGDTIVATAAQRAPVSLAGTGAMGLPSGPPAAQCRCWRCIAICLPKRSIISAMTQKPETEAEPVQPNLGRSCPRAFPTSRAARPRRFSRC